MTGRAASVRYLCGAIGDCNLQTGVLRGALNAAVATIIDHSVSEWGP
jgi:hypothetical protein